MTSVTAYAPPKITRLEVSPEWARLLTRLQQLRSQGGAVVVIDLSAMTLCVVGRIEHIAPKSEMVVQSRQ